MDLIAHRSAKPDVVAPGVGIESTADSSSALFLSNPASRLWGTIPTTIEPYLRLTGTSMSAPIVTAAGDMVINSPARASAWAEQMTTRLTLSCGRESRRRSVRQA